MSSSNPSLPPAPAPVPPPMTAAISSPLRRARDDPEDDDDDALEEGELRLPVVPVPESSAADTDDDKPRYLFQPRAEHDPDSNPVRRPHHRRAPPRPRLGSLHALDILLLGAGAGGALPSPTPSSAGEECEAESDATLSDDGGRGGCGLAVVERGWAATGRRGWKAGGGKESESKKRARAVVFSDSDGDEESDLKLNTGCAASGGVQPAGTGITSIIAQVVPAALHHHQPPPPLPKQDAQPPRAIQAPPVPKQEAQPPRAPQQPAPPTPPAPRRARQRATEYTCQECGRTYPTHQALGGHAAGHRNKQREAEAMAAAMAAAAAGGDGSGASLAAAFPPLLGRGGGGKAHECRHCGKVFGSGVALGGHMRVHYTGPPIVPNRKNKKRCLAPPPIVPQAAAPPVGLSLGLSIKAEENVVAAAAPAVATAAGLSLELSVKTEEEAPSTPPPAAPPAGGVVGVVRLFGIDISPEQAPAAPLQQQQSSGGTTTEDSSSTTVHGQEQH